MTESDGRCCVLTNSTVEISDTKRSVETVLECVHKNISTCHYTYVTQFRAHQEQVCTESYSKHCSITFAKIPEVENVQKCYKPLVSVCDEDSDSDDEVVCRTYYESVCTTRYEGNHADTKCMKEPKELCGARRCKVKEAEEEECHTKEVTSMREVPEEICSLQPVQTCQHVTKLVPSLSPTHVCTVQPRHVCQLTRVPGVVPRRPTLTKWCKEADEDEGGQLPRVGREKKTKNLPEKIPIKIRSNNLQKNSSVKTENTSKFHIDASNKENIKVNHPKNINREQNSSPPNSENKKLRNLKNKKSKGNNSSRRTISNKQSRRKGKVKVPKLSRPVFDDILGEVHGADFPQSRSKTNYNQNKHGIEHLDNVIVTDGNDKDLKSGVDTSAADIVNNTDNAEAVEMDHILSSLPPASVRPFKSSSPSVSSPVTPSTTTKPTPTTTKASKHAVNDGHVNREGNNNETKKPTKKNGYLPRKNKSYLPDPKSVSFPNKHKTKNKSYLPDPGNSSSKFKSKSKSFLPLSGLSLPPPPSPKSPPTTVNNLVPPPPPPSVVSDLNTTNAGNKQSDDVNTIVSVTEPLGDNYNNFHKLRTPTSKQMKEIDNNNRDVDDDLDNVVITKNNKINDVNAAPSKSSRFGKKLRNNKKKQKHGKSYLPFSKKSKSTTDKAEADEDTIKDRPFVNFSQNNALSKNKNSLRKKQNKNIPNHRLGRPKNGKTKSKLPRVNSSRNKKTEANNEELPFYSLPDSIFDELPEYFRPEPRGLAALISLSQENLDQDTRKRLKRYFQQ